MPAEQEGRLGGDHTRAIDDRVYGLPGRLMITDDPPYAFALVIISV